MFRLIYEGPLPANGTPVQKQAIRDALRPQLQDLWSRPPFAALAAHRGAFTPPVNPPDHNQVSFVVQRGGHNFVSVIHRGAALVCHLDILFLRPRDPGELIHGGDLDNRLKTLFDALTVPDDNQVLAAPPAPVNPYFCLLQDDALITQVRIDTDRLLRPAPVPAQLVHLVITVTVKATALSFANMDLVG